MVSDILKGGWQKIAVQPAELKIDTTLRCGQAFRWRKINDTWRCAINGRILYLKQDLKFLYFKAVWPKECLAKDEDSKDNTADVAAQTDDNEAFLMSYFNLHIDLQSLYKKWSLNDPNFQRKASVYPGIRILNQDAWETLVCFICSSNNNIARISQMAHKLSLSYGRYLGTVDGEDLHDFPNPLALAGPDVERHLRELGFGYRAKYVARTAQAVVNERPTGWLTSLRNPESPLWPGKHFQADPGMSYMAVHEQLLNLSGVGAKVADCVCLMGLAWNEAVPVDTHVWQIAVRDYKFSKAKSKTFTKAMHEAVGNHFRELWGIYAGWAQSVLFTANLKPFLDQGSSREATKKEAAPPAARKRKLAVPSAVIEAGLDEDFTDIRRTRSRKRGQ